MAAKSGVRGRYLLVIAMIAAIWAIGIIANAAGSGSEQAGRPARSSGSAQSTAPTVDGQNIRSWHSDVTISRDGATTVAETIVYDFGTSEHHGIFRDIPVRFPYDDVKKGYDRVTPLTVVSVAASVPGAGEYTVQHPSDKVVRIRIGNPAAYVHGVVTYKIRYRLRGALNHFADHDELDLDITGPYWEVPIRDVTATVHGPASVTKATCYAGSPGSTLPCDQVSSPGSSVTFSEDVLPPGNTLTTVTALPPGSISPTPTPILRKRWSLGSAFSVRADTVGIAGAGTILAVLLFSLLAYRVGRDRRWRGSAVDAAFGNLGAGVERVPALNREETPVEFAPPQDLRPGQVSVLLHERARPLDVTATIIDLASRGFLTISEVDSPHHDPDWTLTKVKDAEGLKEYEQTIFDGLFTAGDEVTLSSLRTHFAQTLHTAERQLVDDTITQGWFRRRPATVRAAWRGIGVLVGLAGAGLTAGLAATTTFGLAGLPLVLLGILLVLGAPWFPYRTAKGHAVFRHVLGFKRFIDESEAERARFAERKELFTEYLPYAVVFGNTERWAHAFAGLDEQPPSPDWYVGMTPFTVFGFVAVMSSFSMASAGALAAAPAPQMSTGGFAAGGFSGFGGGFAGGGFGGGGGGAW